MILYNAHHHHHHPTSKGRLNEDSLRLLQDSGIVGLNEVAETGAPVKVVRKLGFGRCRISLAVPKTADYDGLQWFEGKSIATSYPTILRNFLKEKGIKSLSLQKPPLSG